MHDALVRTESTKQRQAPILDGSTTLERFVENVTQLGQGDVFARALLPISAALVRGEFAPPETIRGLAVRALESGDPATRVNAAGLLWYSSRTSDAAVRAYLKSVIDPALQWSANAFDESMTVFSEKPTAPGALPLHGLSLPVATAVHHLLRSAPGSAKIGPAIEAAMWPGFGGTEHLRFFDTARAALEWSTLPMEERLPLADRLHAYAMDRSGYSYRTGRMLASMLTQRPDLAHLAPHRLMMQLGAVMPVDEFTKSEAFRQLTQGDYLQELRALKSKLASVPADQMARAQLQIASIDEVLERPVFGRPIKDWEVGVAIAEGRELGLSSEVIFNALQKIDFRASPSASTELAELLLESGVSDALVREHLAPLIVAAKQYGKVPALFQMLMARVPPDKTLHARCEGLGGLHRAAKIIPAPSLHAFSHIFRRPRPASQGPRAWPRSRRPRAARETHAPARRLWRVHRSAKT